MSVDSRDVNSQKKSKIMLDEHTNNDSSSASASISNNDESLDSSSNERCVVDGVIKQTLPRSSQLIGSDDDSDKTVQLNDSFTVEKADGQRKTNSTSNTNRPLFSISFRNQQTARKYKSSIKKFLKDLISNHDPDTEEYDTSDLELDVWENESEDSQDADVQIEDSSLFEIDTKPMAKNELAVPTYSQKYKEVLKEVDKEDKDKDKKGNGSSKPTSCFNCLGNHSLRDCPLPRDGNAIANNRRQFVNRYGTPKTSRYHMDDEQRFANLVPGQISNKLSKALGLSKHRLPKYIYRMRLLGYPPGWMEDAKVSHSGLMLYDSQGKEVADPEAEEGEIIAEGSRDKYDIKKIISYPGFNVPCSPGTLDEYEYHHCPSQSIEQSKEKMLAELSQNSTKAYKRRRMTATPAKPTKVDDDLSQAEMEVEESIEPGVSFLPPDDNCRFIPPLPKDTPPRPPPPPSTESDSEGGESRSQGVASPVSTGQSGMSSPRAQSPSLSDLETRKQLLLAELEDGGSSSDTGTQKTPTTPAPANSNLGKVKSVDLGTPILKSASPYSRLPNPEKFSVDICDVINFENLPDSTGKYEKMTDLLRKVRTVVSQIQQDDDDDVDGGK